MDNQKDLEQEVREAARQFARSLNHGRTVVADLSEITEVTSRLPLSNLDQWERLLRWEIWSELIASSAGKWRFWKVKEPVLSWMDLCGGDGYRREKTLRALSDGAPNRFFFAMAVRRLNDWVPQVRQAAREKLKGLAVNTDPGHVADVLCVVLRDWNSWGRMEEANRDLLLEIVSVDRVARSLKHRIVFNTAGPMTTVLSQAGRTPVFDTYLPEIARSALQPSVRAKAYRCLFDGKIAWSVGKKWVWTDIRYCKGKFRTHLVERPISVKTPFMETLTAALVDRSPMVRRVAGEILIREWKRVGLEAVELAKLLAADNCPSVAERGQFALRRANDLGV